MNKKELYDFTQELSREIGRLSSYAQSLENKLRWAVVLLRGIELAAIENKILRESVEEFLNEHRKLV